MIRGVESLYIPPQGRGNSKIKPIPGMGRGLICESSSCDSNSCDCGGCDCGSGSPHTPPRIPKR